MRALLLTLAACGGANFTVARGFVGSIGTCIPLSATGAVSLSSEGWVHGDAVGTGVLKCGDDGTEKVAVRELARLAIDGPSTVTAGEAVYYRLEAYDAHGTELTLTDDPNIGWWIAGGEIHPAYCGDTPELGCPGYDSAMVRARAGTTTIGVVYLGKTATLAVTAR